MSANKCWSADNELFNYSDLGDLLDSNEDLKAGDTVYVADAVPPNVAHLCDVNDVLDTISDRAYDMAGEYSEDCAKVSDEARAELAVFLEEWINKHCNLNFYTVRNAQPYTLTDDDMQAQGER